MSDDHDNEETTVEEVPDEVPMTEEKEESPEKAERKSEVSSGDAVAAIKGMFSFFTILPINIGQREMDAMNRNFWLIPLVGLFYGLISVGVFALVSHFTDMVLGCILSIFAVEAVNRFLHFDGLIDVGDGLMVAGGREDHKRALKDTLVGAGGVATAVIFVLMMFGAINAVDFDCVAVALLVCEVLARFAQVVTAAFGEPSNGMAGESVRNTDRTSMIMSGILTVVLLIIGCFLMAVLTNAMLGVWPPKECYVAVIMAAFAAFGWGWVMYRVAMKNFGFVNGDVLGATNQTTRFIVLLVIAFVEINMV